MYPAYTRFWGETKSILKWTMIPRPTEKSLSLMNWRPLPIHVDLK